MSTEQANKLMSAESAEAFLSAQGGRVGRDLFAALKSEVDRLVHSDLNEASRLVERIEQLAALSSDAPSNAFAGASRARLLHLLGRHSEANRFYASAVSTMREAGLRGEAAIIQKQQVDALTHMGRYDDALSAARAARRVLSKGDPIQLAQLEMNVGNVYYLLDRYKKALHHYDLARKNILAADDESMLAFVDFSRSNIFTEMDRPDEAMALLESAADAWAKAGQTLLSAQARFHVAYLQFLRGHHNTAMASYYKTREHLTEIGGDHLVAWCNLEIAEILLALNAFDEAAESAEKARARFHEIEMPYESAKAAMTHALALMGMSRFERARSDLMEAREAFALSRNTIYAALVDSYLAELALRCDDHEEAAIRANMSLRVFARQKLVTKSAHSRLLVARAAYGAGNTTKAARMARNALRTVEALFAPGVIYQCHHLIGKIDRDRQRTRSALESFRLAVKTIEQMRGGIVADEFKATFLRDKIEVYEDAISACLDEGSELLLQEAFRLVESSKSRALADLMARYLRDKPSPARLKKESSSEHETRSRLLKLIEDLNWYNSHAGIEDEKGDQRRAVVADRYRNKVIGCEKQIAQLFRRLESSGSAFAEVQRMQSVSASELRNVLEPGETAIEYFTTGDEISAFVATQARIRVARRIASKSEVEQMLAALRFQLEKFNYGHGFADFHFEQLNHATNQHLIRLCESIFSPLESFIEGDNLIVIPHGALHYLPFHALLDRKGYLIDRFEISYAPSATVLKLCRARDEQIRNGKSARSESKSRTLDIVALGVAHRDTPSVETEVRALSEIFPRAVALTGDKATRANLMAAALGTRFLHLASHGYFRRDNPMFSFLKLADSPLNFYSLLDLELNAEMVTLSACHTGVNMVFPGDELHGLMRGFLYAGTPSLVASLWAANDASTAEFMREMYSRIKAGATKRAALRAAQLAVKDEYGHPYYWAPFVLMGNPN